MPLRVDTLVEQCALDQTGNNPISRPAFTKTWLAFVDVVTAVVRRGKGVKIPRFGTFSRDAETGDVLFVPALELGLSARPGARIGGSHTFANLEPLRYGEVAATAGEDKKDAQRILSTLLAAIVDGVKRGGGMILDMSPLGTLSCRPGEKRVTLEPKNPRAVSRAWRAASRRSWRRSDSRRSRARAHAGLPPPRHSQSSGHLPPSSRGGGDVQSARGRPVQGRAPTPGPPPLGSTFLDEGEEGEGVGFSPSPRNGHQDSPSGGGGLQVEERDELDYTSPTHGGGDTLPGPASAKFTSRRGDRSRLPSRSLSHRSRPATQRSAGKPFPVESSYEEPDNAAHARDLLAQMRHNARRRDVEAKAEEEAAADRADREFAALQADRARSQRAREEEMAVQRHQRQQEEEQRAREQAERSQGEVYSQWPFGDNEEARQQQQSVNDRFKRDLDLQRQQQQQQQTRFPALASRAGVGSRRDPRFGGGSTMAGQQQGSPLARGQSLFSSAPMLGVSGTKAAPPPPLATGVSPQAKAAMRSRAASEALRDAYDRYYQDLRRSVERVAKREEEKAAQAAREEREKEEEQRRAKQHRRSVNDFIVKQAREKRLRDQQQRAERLNMPQIVPGEPAPFPVAVDQDPHGSVRAQERLRQELDRQVEEKRRRAVEQRLAEIQEDHETLEEVEGQVEEERRASEEARRQAAASLREEWGRQAMLKTILGDLQSKEE